MRRRETTLDPAVAAELEALEAALAGAPGAEPELAALVRDVRAQAPAMTPAFRAGLDERVASDFARGDQRARSRAGARESGATARRAGSLAAALRARLPRHSLLPALGVAGCLLAGLVAIVVTSGGGSGRDHGNGGAAPAVAQRESAPPTAAGSGSSSASGDSAGSSAGAGAGTGSTDLAAPKSSPSLAPQRRVERSTRLELTTTDVQRAADGVVRATQAVGGFVADSQVHTGDGSGGASFVLRVPAAKLDDALAALSKLGHVRSLEQSADDITGAYDSASARLAETRAGRRALLRALAKATTAQEISSLRARLADNRRELARRQSAFNTVRRRADLATIEAELVGRPRKQVAAPSGGKWTPGDAAHDALRVLEVSAGVALIALAVLVPLAILAAAGRIAAGAWRRRRREAALSTAL
jgi:hypothetical protein